ncbi:TPA: hypothetical protein ACNRKE_003937 [Escherichia coli]
MALRHASYGLRGICCCGSLGCSALLKGFIVSKFAVSALWATPVKGALLWGVGKMVAAIRRKITPSN